MELYYGITLQKQITGLYYGIILWNYITGLYYQFILRDCIMELYYGIILMQNNPADPRVGPGAPRDLQEPVVAPLGPPGAVRPMDPGHAPGTPPGPTHAPPRP